MTEATKELLSAAIDRALSEPPCLDCLPDGCGIYVLVNQASRSVYVGQSVNIRRRGLMHKTDMRSGHPNVGVREDHQKHGAESFCMAVVQFCQPDDLDPLEKAYVRLTAAEWPCHNIQLLTDPKPGNVRVKEFETRQKEAGLMRACAWLHPDDAAALREHAAKLAKRRERIARQMSREVNSL